MARVPKSVSKHNRLEVVGGGGNALRGACIDDFDDLRQFVNRRKTNNCISDEL